MFAVGRVLALLLVAATLPLFISNFGCDALSPRSVVPYAHMYTAQKSEYYNNIPKTRQNLQLIEQFQNEHEVYPVSDGEPQTYDAIFNYTKIDQVINGQLIHGHMFNLTNPIHHFGIKPPFNFLAGPKCPCGRVPTSTTAKAHDCIVAINGGFFNMQTGACMGYVASDGVLLQDPGYVPNVNFGITPDGNYVIGYLTSAEVKSYAFENLITGVLWIVRGGHIYLDESVAVEQPSYDFVWEKAPRVAIGHDVHGNLLLFEVDGNEFLNAGLDMYEWATFIQSKGAINAINLDGGGSATVYYKENIVNQLSEYCGFLASECERPVTTVVCIRDRPQ